MKHAALAAIALAIATFGAEAPAQAPVQVIAYTAKPVNLRAGPARDYPVVAVLPAGFQVAVQGCLSTYAWCDVIAGYDRGWVYAGNINYPYQNQWQPLLTWGPMIGIAILGFTFDDYWHRHYWNRPWYGERERWAHVPPPRFVRPRPAVPPHGDEGWRDRRDDHRPRGQVPRDPSAPHVRPAPVPQPQPQRPPGWRPEPRMGPVPRQAVPQQAQPQRAPAQPQPAPAQQQRPARGGERHEERR